MTKHSAREPHEQRFEDEQPPEETPQPGASVQKRRKAGPFSTWKAYQLRGISKEILETESLLLPRRVYENERNPLVPSKDHAGLNITAALATREERLIEVLRFLGRVYVADLATIFHMLYRRRYDMSTTQRDLRIAKERKLVWVDRALGLYKKKGGEPTRPPMIYGLSTIGRQFLKNQASEPNSDFLKLMHTHQPTNANPVNQATIGHDLQVSWWCGSMIECLRLIPWCTSIFCHTEVRSHETQRIDAVIVARFNFDHPREMDDTIPWFDGRKKHNDEVEVRWALELDNSTESDLVLLKKFLTYRQLHAEGVYHRLFGGNTILVLIAQHATRAATLAMEFQRAWPDGWGLVSTPDRKGADASPFGVLWGVYSDMNLEEPVPLLSRIIRLPSGEFAYETLLTLEQWRAYLQFAKEGDPPKTRRELVARIQSQKSEN